MHSPLSICAVLTLPLIITGCGSYSSITRSKDLTIHWNIPTEVNQTIPTLQVVLNPHLLPGDRLGTAAFDAIHSLEPDYVRLQGWIPYPKLAVAELQAPTPQSTSWDFSLIDPMVDKFTTATAAHPSVIDFSTIPQWMFVTDAQVAFPADPKQETWNYEQGTELRDPTLTELADYYRRLAGWYVSGGFTDENGRWLDSGHHFQFPIWEVLNEPDSEHGTTAEEYTRRYDAIVDAVRSVSPGTKFMGLSLSQPAAHLDFIRYFLNPSNHLPDIPIDYISYHFYAVPGSQETIADWQYSLFQQADNFLDTVRCVEAIRKQLSPATKTDIDEFGSILPTDAPPAVGVAPPTAWWNLSAAVYAFTWVKLARMQIDIFGDSQLIGFPTQYQSLSMMDWSTNQPNARFWALKLLKDSFHPGDQMIDTSLNSVIASDVEAQGYITSFGRKLLLINKRNRAIEVALPMGRAAAILTVDAQSAEGPARIINAINGSISLQPFAVTVVSWNTM